MSFLRTDWSFLRFNLLHPTMLCAKLIDEICPVVLEKIFKFHQCNFIILLISSLVPYSIKREIPLTQGCFFSSLVEIGTVIQEETIFKSMYFPFFVFISP